METTPYVPYQAYKSKRHSRNLSNQHSSPSPTRPSSIITIVNGAIRNGATSPLGQDFRGRDLLRNGNSHYTVSNASPSIETPITNHMSAMKVTDSVSSTTPVRVQASPVSSVGKGGLIHDPTLHLPIDSVHLVPTVSASATQTISAPASPPSPIPASTTSSSSSASTPAAPVVSAAQTESSAGPSTRPATTMPIRRISTFRHVPLRNKPAPSAPSPLRPNATHTRTVSLMSQQLDQAPAQKERPRSVLSSSPVSRAASASGGIHNNPSGLHGHTSSVPLPSRDVHHRHERIHADSFQPHTRTTSLGHPPQPPPKSPSPAMTPTISTPPSPSTSPFPHTHTSVRTTAPYRPGFQPKGVYRPLTDEFLVARRALHDVGRVERTRLERRLEKLISLHFGAEAQKRANPRTQPARRSSSFFDIDIKDLRNMGAGDLWKGMIQSQVTPGSKADIRAQEQIITPWQNDADVSQCPLCATSFHPITNRKHHCRLCGRIICSLPVKRGQRPITCSLLFVADPKSGQIEEVGEGVDYGVRKRSSVGTQGKGKVKEELSEEEKFLKGVRICRDCAPILKRQQYSQEAVRVPTFAKLYETFINLEQEIEDALPLFQELLLSLNHEDQPTAEASAARKRLLEAFGQYDSLAKRIRTLPTPGPGSSQDRVQASILTRAGIFLQKHMFPLQSLPKPKKSTSSPASVHEKPIIDPDSQLAHVLQPLLEQEALLESFVEEAKAHRKFEDARTLKLNLQEIRAEIDKVLANAEGDRLHREGMGTEGVGKGKSR
ncbi:hypothetical protein EW146_g711 [Bondarzewia mesenterica]|uniref:FYVE-type domain-containing protein n=1 Tax=Bondarzewia mesenterica TaxID=1095465 RepID=A0A4S4M7G9_9AGAM|nr:hypothetical protein EW146_g711 [Bondarzewia mesenterica]